MNMHANRKDRICERTEFSSVLRYRFLRYPSPAALRRLFRRSIGEPWNNRWPARLTCSGSAARRFPTSIGSSPACSKIRRNSPGRAARYSIRMPTRMLSYPSRACRGGATICRDPTTANRVVPRYGRASQTSIHSAATSSAMRDGAMRTALWIEPAAGTTSSNAVSETSQ